MSKTLVLVVSDKGGTGKSTWARAYADWLRRKHPTAFLADADGTVGQLLQFYGSRGADGVLSREQDGRVGVAFFDIHRDRGAMPPSMALTGRGACSHRPPGWCHQAACRVQHRSRLSGAFPAQRLFHHARQRHHTHARQRAHRGASQRNVPRH